MPKNVTPDFIRSVALQTMERCQEFRPGKAFTTEEACVAFASSICWLMISIRTFEKGDPSGLRSPNDSARTAATTFMRMIADIESKSAAAKRAFPGFNPQLEISWANERSSHDAWNQCLTRATIMGTRAFAYAYTGVLGFTDEHGVHHRSDEPLGIPEGTSLAEIAQSWQVWASKELGDELTSVLMDNLEMASFLLDSMGA